ncbi:Fido, protein-threonine AMPylation domain-containing protein [Xylanibacter ruminicola]|uniref:protein adenylyltransferase n=1 Tax=Xylanibacter ruminicola TaxID=839 RepID=A0A1M7LCU0_XYLRU|nr:Fic family protein [Xylanibacter ruminicola]SFC80329.1 Fido, protein-threonine AMPylation domain-containing protein [Xylanibacter ruminicola]SHM75828.1 Fido, protein-threonine AMPylation domain-containing protein [Xylanibacter ruminicola]
MSQDNKYIDFDEYIRQGEPGKREKAEYWQTAIGLQAVDGLKTSDYLKETARKHIEGDIDIDQARELIKSYYQSKSVREPDDDEKQEADKVSANITKILSSETFDFSSNGIISLHRRIFEGVFKHAGKVRDYNITKKEWVLEGDTVNYLNWEDLQRALDYDLKQEHKFSYKCISHDAMIAHIASFVSGIWQIHAFGEGNTRTTAVFTILYLRHIGFKVNNEMFANHSWYFRNALVRANYKNAVKGIDYSPVYLERFFRNLLLGEQWDLRNRYLHINPTQEWSVQPNLANTPTSTPASTPTSSGFTDNSNIIKLVKALGEEQRSLKELLALVGLKDRKNFLEYSLNPSIAAGLICMLYPNSPRHPRQKYLLTPRGLEFYNKLK